jgi:guanosine-3',5'-bis(diphosphate) 3'-pyrophosphohydrolase
MVGGRFMNNSVDKLYRPLLEAISFASRAHRGQLRKDDQTPYVAHAFRVCMLLRDLFGVNDRRILIAAVLHDVLEDTTTDFDDLEEKFDAEIAHWVALLSKDKRLPYDEREAAYQKALAEAPWQVQVCKLADVIDNLLDMPHVPPHKRGKSVQNKRRYVEALKGHLQPEAERAWQLALAVLTDLESHGLD